ncbi:hypothetical protein HanHA300_Chr08g0266991 [Helianthus annuus]|nr:hypothetical protein HanHA300_Chr08g0266991 [Helianthus annuus]KAJ0721242.1 hypothetical protein HanOQP8_Chr08g0273411 [Helianthus annuus]
MGTVCSGVIGPRPLSTPNSLIIHLRFTIYFFHKILNYQKPTTQNTITSQIPKGQKKNRHFEISNSLTLKFKVSTLQEYIKFLPLKSSNFMFISTCTFFFAITNFKIENYNFIRVH